MWRNPAMSEKPRTRRNITVAHRTSMLLEDPFWEALDDCARERGVGTGDIVAEAESRYPGANRSAAARMHVIDLYRARHIEG